MSKIFGTDCEYSFGETKMLGYFSVAAEGPAARPGVLIVHDAFGLDTHCIGVADRLAVLGYAAFAVDLWGDRRQLTMEAALPAITGLRADRAEWMGPVEAARSCLTEQTGVDGARIAAIGYCWGGSTVLEFARCGHDVRGVVSFHGGLDMVGTDWQAARPGVKLLVCTGADDPLVPWTALTDFQNHARDGDVHWELDVYSHAKHSFTRADAAARSDPSRSGYDAQADRRSWRAMVDFLDEVFEGGDR